MKNQDPQQQIQQLSKDNVNLKKLYQKQLIMIKRLQLDNRKLEREKTTLTETITKMKKSQQE